MSAEKLGSPTVTTDIASEEGPEPADVKEGEESAEEGEEPAGDSASTSQLNHSAVQVITRFMCKYCGRQFIRRADMDAHATLHDDERPPLTCGVCGKLYTTRSKLQRHVRVHSGERPFPCAVCGKRFPRSDHVKQHMRVHAKLALELSTSPVPLGLTHKSHCRMCGVKFEEKSELNKHLLTHGFNKLFSCIYCGEVFESNEKLKTHKQSHENHFDEFLPVLSVPDPSFTSKSSALLAKNSLRRRKPGRPKGSKTTVKRKKDLSRLGLSKFKIARRSGSEGWRTVAPVMKTEATTSPDQPVTTSDKSMPILERILMDSGKPTFVVKAEENAGNNDSDADNKSDDSGIPQMSISACYSLAEGQDNSDIPDIEEIRASTLTDGHNMIVLPAGLDSREEEEEEEEEEDDDQSQASDREESGDCGASVGDVSCSTSVCAVTGTRCGEGDGRTPQATFIRPTILPSTATATATLMALQQQVYPQMVSAASLITPTTISPAQAVPSSTTTRPTISLLPNMLTFRTHPILTTPTLNLAHSPAVQPTPTSTLYNTPTPTLYNTPNRLYNPIANFPAACLNMAGMEMLPPGRKMMRCHHCCIWFEDSALGLLHQSLHSADETDPFTCKKCLKRLGNRLEFTAHIIWHLDPTMEDSAAL